LREPFVHQVSLAWDAGHDPRAPGGTVTEDLCGSLDHPPPCPLASHHTATRRVGDRLEVRVLFACEPDDEMVVRDRIDAAVGERWRVVASGPDDVRADETAHAARLVTS
jgi:hypothetical protein